MPRYYFDIHDGERFTTDETGVELDAPEAAREEAVSALVQSAREGMPQDDRREVVIQVRDESNTRVLVAKLSMTIEHTEYPPPFSPVA